MNAKIFYNVFVSILFCLTTECYAQKGVVLTTGYSLPELLNLGLNYQFKQNQIGVSYGKLLYNPLERISYSISAQYFYHYGGKSKLSTERKPWFLKLGLTHIHDESEYTIRTYKYVNTQVGRENNFSQKFGIRLDLGLFYEVHKKEIKKKEPLFDLDLNLDFKVLPAFGLVFYYKI